MKKMLVTGAAGNIGSALTLALCKRNRYSVLAVDDLSTGSIAKLPSPATENYRFIKADVNDYSEISAIFLKYGFDYVFHFAAVVGVERTLANPLKVLDDIQGIKNVLNLAKNVGVERVFYSSSSEVYGEPVSLPQNEETTPLNSRLPYAIVKNIGEAYFRSYYQEHGLHYTIFRFFNTYGPNQSEDFVLPKFLKAALENEDITIYGDGLQTRTFCHVDDNVDTMLATLEDSLHIDGVLNIGSDEEITILDLARLVIERTNSTSKNNHLPPLPEGDMTRRMPDITKMKHILKRDLISVGDGIDMLLEKKEIKSRV